MKTRTSFGFQLSVSARDDGTTEAIYVKLSEEKVARTQEVRGDALLADYSAEGELVGIEILAPVSLSTVLRLVDAPKRRFLRRLIEDVPEPLVLPAARQPRRAAV